VASIILADLLEARKRVENKKPKYFVWPVEEDIPEEFHSVDTEGPFQTCCVCEKRLVESNEPYLIEKSYKRVNEEVEHVVYEYAICMECAQDMNGKISKESLSNLQAYFKSSLSPMSVVQRMEEREVNDKFWYSKCMVKGTNRTDTAEYNLCGMFQGDKMLVGEFPYIISLEAMEELTELLSDETKDEFDDFKKNLLGGPPELEELLKGRPVLVI
jgi:hypothetical protein